MLDKTLEKTKAKASARIFTLEQMLFLNFLAFMLGALITLSIL